MFHHFLQFQRQPVEPEVMPITLHRVVDLGAEGIFLSPRADQVMLGAILLLRGMPVEMDTVLARIAEVEVVGQAA